MAITAEEALEILKFQGLDPDQLESIDEAKQFFEKDYIKRKNAYDDKEFVNSIVGRKLGEVETNIKKSFKELGADFEIAEAKGIDEVLRAGSEKLQGRINSYEEKIAEVKKQGGKGSNEKIAEFEIQIEKLNKQLNEEKERAEAAINQVKEIETNYAKKERESIKNREWEKLMSGAKFSQDTDDLKKRGFVSMLKENYNFDLNDEGEYVALDKEGNRIKSADKAYEYMTPSQILEKEAKDRNLWAENPNGGKPIQERKLEPQGKGFVETPKQVRPVMKPSKPMTMRP